MRTLKASLVLAVLLALLPMPAQAQTICSTLTWTETRTAAFSFIYDEDEPLGQEIANRYGAILDDEYNRFANLFNNAPTAPIAVRLYPNETDFYCFNPLAEQLSAEDLVEQCRSRFVPMGHAESLSDRRAPH